MKQTLRALLDIGVLRLLFLLVIATFLGYMLFLASSQKPHAYYVSAAFLIILSMIQLNRKDKLFIKTHFISFKVVAFTEYLTLALFLLILLIFNAMWLAAVSIIAGILVIIQLNKLPKQTNLNSKLQGLIPNELYEWKAGIRKTMYFLVPVWIIGLATSFFVGSVPLVIFITGIAVSAFYEKGEPYQMIIAVEKSSANFLASKLYYQTKLFSIIALPLIILYFYFHIDLWYIPVAEYLIFILLHAYLILTKYAFYETNEKSAAARVYGTIGFLGTIIPIFMPLVLVLAVRFYFKSIDKLNYYLDDFN